MKKRMVWASIFIAALLLVTAGSCKDSGIDFVWEELEGSGAYSSATDTSTITLNGLVRYYQQRVSSDYLFARLVDWIFVIKEGDDVVLVVSKNNYQDVLSGLFVNISGEEEEYVYVRVQTNIPMSGDIFNGRNPDTVELQMLILDGHNNEYTVNGATTFQFTRD